MWEHLSTHNLKAVKHFNWHTLSADNNITLFWLCVHKYVRCGSTTLFPWQFSWLMQMTCLGFLAHQEEQQIFEHRFTEPVGAIPAPPKLCWKMCPLNYSHKPPCPFISAGFLLVGCKEGGERKHIWATMFIHWISYLCSTRGNIYADDRWLYLTALLQPPPGNTECGVNKGPQQQNHETDKTVTNWHSHVRNTQWYLLSGHSLSHTLIMINISPTA